MIGTRYHAADTYAEILKQGSVMPRIHPATADGGMEGEPVFLTPEALAEKRRDMGPYVFACQMLQNPLADSVMGFKEEWWRSFEAMRDISGLNVYIAVDPASSKKSGSDYTSMWVIGLNTDSAYYVLDGLRDRLNLTERARALFELHRKYRPLAVGYEKYGMQADTEHMRYLMEHENYRFNIIELGGQMSKPDRIRRLAPLFEQGRIWFPLRLMKMRLDNTAYDLVHEFRREEYASFPVSAHDDMLDCLSRIVDPELGAIFPRHPMHYSDLPRKTRCVSNKYD
jgi:predicted phage terminase large subunit-like protein